HMIPDASIAVVHLSVNGNIKPDLCVELGRKLAPLREQRYLIWGSGNIVHNQRRHEWNNRGGSDHAERFSKYNVDRVL
ncbi:dioxygenase, partial [Megasphaera massiliensis]|nr:dioxygenase [Megasphaera massiliensis]